MAPRSSAEKSSMKVSLSRQSGLRAEASGHFGIAATTLVVIFLAVIAFGLPG